MAEKILVVDDEDIIRDSIAIILEKEGYHVEKAENGAAAFEKLNDSTFDLVITDIEMPMMRGIELLEKITERFPQTFVIIITAYASVETAVGALRKGAYDYILKPIEFDDLVFRVKKMFEYRNVTMENTLLRQEVNRKYDFHNIIGKSDAMKRVFSTIEKVSRSEGTVLITGGSGTGKELVARAIHFNSSRKAKRFVAINCGAIVETLFESELFGHKKGSFTGAVSDKDGVFKVASGGTLFLDEISEMPFHMQVKLLRAIEQREIQPVGSNDLISIDVRIVAATNRNLREEIAKGKFREDLFYRLNVVEIHLPDLNERIDDIPLLVNTFITNLRNQMGKNIKGITNNAMNAIVRHQWKGQVRELQNVVERAMIFCDAEYLDIQHLPEDLQRLVNPSVASNMSTGLSLKDAVHNFERQYIENKLKENSFDKERVAKELGLSLSTLYRKLEELQLSGKQKNN
ncbi:MAG: sigma-54-dependent Fis family transcriptional regulator [Bacteroidetes bacterium]|nr:sigma-54-dependent Fis family transcriptional regulator [Bacteroidota bacterium]